MLSIAVFLLVVLLLQGEHVATASSVGRRGKLQRMRATPLPTDLDASVSFSAMQSDQLATTIVAYDRDTSGGTTYSYNNKRSASNSLQDRIEHAMPYLTQANPASIGILFLLLIWRLLGIYEIADNKGNQISAIAVKYGTVCLLACNVAGFLAAVFRPVALKNHLKVILASNILREGLEAMFNMFMILTAKATLRELHFGRLLMNLWWGYLCFSFSKSRWVAQLVPSRFEQQNPQQ